MKKLIIALLCLVTLNVKADILTKTDSVVKTAQDSVTKLVNDSTKLTWLKVYEDTKEGIVTLAKALKVPAEHVYAVLVKQQVVKAVTAAAWCLLLILIPTIFWKRLYNWAKDRQDDSDGTSWIAFALGAVAPIVIGIIALCIQMTDITTGIINPEYGAIQDIWNFVKH